MLQVPVAIINEGPQAVVRYVAFLADFHFGEQVCCSTQPSLA